MELSGGPPRQQDRAPFVALHNCTGTARYEQTAKETFCYFEQAPQRSSASLSQHLTPLAKRLDEPS